MAKLKTYEAITVVSSTTYTIDLASPADIYFIGTLPQQQITLSGNFTIDTTGTATAGITLDFVYHCQASLGGNTLDILGTTLTAEQAGEKQIIRATSTGSSWLISVIKDSTSSTKDIIGADIVDASIPTLAIADNAITFVKMQDFAARGNLLRGGTSGAPEEFVAKTSGQILVGDGTDVVSVAVSGDISMSAAGLTTIQPGSVDPAMLSFSIADTLLEASLTITTAQLLALNATPQTIVAAPGAGKYVEVISAGAYTTFVSAAYAANTTMQLITDTATIPQLQDTAILLSTVSKATKFKDVTSATAGQTQIIANKALTVSVATGDPTTGDSDITIKVLYRITEI